VQKSLGSCIFFPFENQIQSILEAKMRYTYFMAFSDHEYYDEKFLGLDQAEAVIGAKAFHDCRFVECDFNGADLSGCVFHDCKFVDCNLSLARLDGCGFMRCQFEGCQLKGVNWARADLAERVLHKPFDFRDCALDYAVFFGADISKVEFRRCMLREADFSDVNLAEADFSGCDLSGARFVNADLQKADFSRAVNYAINANQNNLKGAKFSLPQAVALLQALNIELVD
jgi:uncharacterized protein YjbI with pentapeptide repeats